MILTCAKIQRKVLMFGEAGPPDSIIDLKAKEVEKSVIFAK